MSSKEQVSKMDPWNNYFGRGSAVSSKRDTILEREKRILAETLPDTLNYHEVVLDGEKRGVNILDTQNINIKTITSMPGEDIRHGALLTWGDSKWLITEKDANTELYARGTMQRCNHLLQWVNAKNEIVKRWSIVEDATNYLVGEYGDKFFMMNRGDARLSLIIPQDSETLKLNRSSRFIIDYPGSSDALAFRLTKPHRVGPSYDGEGVLRFVLQECTTEDDDNIELGIADYYKHFPREDHRDPISDDLIEMPVIEVEDRGGWL